METIGRFRECFGVRVQAMARRVSLGFCFGCVSSFDMIPAHVGFGFAVGCSDLGCGVLLV